MGLKDLESKRGLHGDLLVPQMRRQRETLPLYTTLGIEEGGCVTRDIHSFVTEYPSMPDESTALKQLYTTITLYRCDDSSFPCYVIHKLAQSLCSSSADV